MDCCPLHGQTRTQQEAKDLTGPIYKALHATRADLAPSLGPEWSFTLVDTTTSMENYDNHQQSWSILSHRSGGPAHIEEIDISITTVKATTLSKLSSKYDYAKIFVFKDLHSFVESEKQFGQFRYHYRDDQIVHVFSLDDRIFPFPNNGTVKKVLSSIASFFQSNVQETKFIFDGSGGRHEIYASVSNEPVATLYFNGTNSWQLDFHDSVYYTDREKFRMIILKTFTFACTAK